MSSEVHVDPGMGKEERYRQLLPQLEALLNGETNTVANESNFCAALHHNMGFFWTGFYWVDGEQLVLGTFQGPVACTRIPKGKGVCGTAWSSNQVLIVPDVNTFPGHIACSSLSQSEIVVPVRDSSGTVIGVLDVDSTEPGFFDEVDAHFLEQALVILQQKRVA